MATQNPGRILFGIRGKILHGYDGTILFADDLSVVFYRVYVEWDADDVDICAYVEGYEGTEVGYDWGDATKTVNGVRIAWLNGDKTSGGPELVEVGPADVSHGFTPTKIVIHLHWYKGGPGNVTVRAVAYDGTVRTVTATPSEQGSSYRKADTSDPSVSFSFDKHGNFTS